MNDATETINMGHLETIRKEANDVKDCFTKYSFQAFAFVSAILGLILKYQKDDPSLTFAVLVGIIILIVVARIGTHKYSTANRNYGFELFLARSKKFKYGVEVSWEEALLAWRIVQATVFAEIFHTGGKYTDRPRDFYHDIITGKTEESKKAWFMTKSLLPVPATFHPGAYLRTMLRLQRKLAMWSHMLFIFPLVQFLSGNTEWQFLETWNFDHHNAVRLGLCMILLVTAGISFVLVNREFKKRFARLKLLEEGFLSIDSCAKMWHAVILAHLIAEQNASSNHQQAYFDELGKQALSLKERIFDIEDWIVQKSAKLPQRRIDSDHIAYV